MSGRKRRLGDVRGNARDKKDLVNMRDASGETPRVAKRQAKKKRPVASKALAA